jgi:hypothetical protein
MGVLQQQYPTALFTSPHLSRSPAVGFISVLSPEAHLPQAPQPVNQLVRNYGIGQAVNVEVPRQGSQGGNYGPQHQSWVEGIWVVACQYGQTPDEPSLARKLEPGTRH